MKVKSGGFSLIEVVVAVGIAGIIAVIVPTLLLQYNQFQTSINQKGSIDAVVADLATTMSQSDTCVAAFGAQTISLAAPTPVDIYGSRGVAILWFKTPTAKQNLLNGNNNWQIQNMQVIPQAQAPDFVVGRTNLMALLQFNIVATDGSTVPLTRTMAIQFHLLTPGNTIAACSSAETLGAARAVVLPACPSDARLDLMQSGPNAQPNWGCKSLDVPASEICQASGAACTVDANCCSGSCYLSACF